MDGTKYIYIVGATLVVAPFVVALIIYMAICGGQPQGLPLQFIIRKFIIRKFSYHKFPNRNPQITKNQIFFLERNN
jgi:hypothetical protein